MKKDIKVESTGGGKAYALAQADPVGRRLAAKLEQAEPVNRYPDFVRNLVRQLKRLFPRMGNERMACREAGLDGRFQIVQIISGG